MLANQNSLKPSGVLAIQSNNSHFKQSLTANLIKKISLTIFVSITIFTVLYIYSYEIYHQYIFQSNDLVYLLAQFIKGNLLTIFITLVALDTIIIFWLRYREMLQYIEKMLEAGKILIQDNNIPINLPPELKEIEDQMNQIKNDALKNKIAIKQAEKQKNDLLLYLAHDLKTPLTSILGYLDLLNTQPKLIEKEKKTYAKIAYDKTIRLEELIEEFFSIAKYNLSDIKLEKQSVNLSVMLAQISYEFMPMYREKNITCNTTIEDNLILTLDINQFERVFDNLIRNAINYSIPNTAINIMAKKENNDIIIKLSNTIDSIDKNKLEHIFEPFVRLDSSRNSNTGGAGLGLTITKKIIELHHGTINASLQDQLICFEIKIPM